MDPLMTFWVFLIGILVGVISGVTLLHRVAILPLHKKIENLTREKQLLSPTGEILEQSWMENYPYSIEDFRYIGNPIDGIQFEDNQILFVTFKTKTSRLTPIQNNVKKLVTEGKVQWFEFKTK